jgi:hypothetical protein
MSDDRFETDLFNAPPPPISGPHPALPDWLASRVLRAGEEVTWVRGPRLNPWWECYITHPALFLVALAFGAACCWAGRLSVESWSQIPPPLVLAAGGIVLASILVLGISAGYFTRLVVTNLRVVILQGYEVCRSWGLDQLPRSLLRYSKRPGEKEKRAVDLDALRTTLGGSSNQFTDSKTILAFGKQLDRIKALENGRPGHDPTAGA